MKDQSTKGQFGKGCNRTACEEAKGADWYNFSTREFYCEECARKINYHNDKEALAMFGHSLCLKSPDGKKVQMEVVISKNPIVRVKVMAAFMEKGWELVGSKKTITGIELFIYTKNIWEE